jgi:ABC-type Fe3+-hydroxamate transport system substrate-binding protein
LHPDLVLMNEEENRIEDADQLRAAGLFVHSSLPRNAAGTAAMVRSIATAIGRIDAGERIAADIEARAERVRVVSKGLTDVSYVYLIWREPWMSVSNDTFVAALLSLAGGLNRVGDTAERYPVLTVEEIRVLDPDIVLLSSEPFPFAERHALELEAALRFSRDRFELVDGELLSWHGSRTPRGIDYAERVVEEARRRRMLAVSFAPPEKRHGQTDKGHDRTAD